MADQRFLKTVEGAEFRAEGGRICGFLRNKPDALVAQSEHTDGARAASPAGLVGIPQYGVFKVNPGLKTLFWSAPVLNDNTSDRFEFSVSTISSDD